MIDLRQTILRQYEAPLAMLRKAIESCPDDLWLSGSPNRFWHIAYHALFYTHFYLSPTDKDFVPWSMHQAGINFLGAVPWKPETPPIAHLMYTPSELLEYHALVLKEANSRLATVAFDAPSGFHWLSFDKLELQLYNIRHLQHHTGQLADRLRQQAGIGLPWVR